MTKDQALALAGTEWWLHANHREIAEFQMGERLLCCPFSVFHEAVEKTLERPVYTHEFGLDWDGLRKELMGERDAPSFDAILALIPEEKRIVIDTGGTPE